MHLRRRRPEASLDRDRGAQARRARGDGAHDRGGGIGVDSRAMQYIARTRLHDGRVFMTTARTRSLSMTTSPAAWAYRQISLLLRPTAGAKPIPATCLSALATAGAFRARE